MVYDTSDLYDNRSYNRFPVGASCCRIGDKMTEPFCVDCGHPVNKHTDFYCLVPECRCNLPATTAQARYEASLWKKKYEFVFDRLKDLYRYHPEWFCKKISDPLDELTLDS